MGIIILQMSGDKISYSNLGLLEAFKDLPIAIVSLFAVSFIGRFGTKKSLLLSLLVVAISCFSMPYLNVFWFLKVWFAVIGICFAIAKISIYGIIRNNIEGDTTLVKVMSSVEAAFMFGIFFVNIGFGWLISSQYSDYWKFGFWMISFLAFLNIFLLYKMKVAENKTVIKTRFFNFPERLFTKNILFFFGIIFTIVFIEVNFNAWLPSFYKNHLSVNSFFALQATAFLALFSYVGRVVTSKIIQHFSLNKYFLTCLSVIFLLLILAQFLLWNGSTRAALFVFPAIGFFLAPLYPVISSKMMVNISKNDINIFTSFIVIFSSLGSSMGSISMAYLFHFGYGNNFALLITFAVIMLYIITVLYFRSYSTKADY